MWNQNYYRVLRVNDSARGQELEEAYRREMAAAHRLRFEWWAGVRRRSVQWAFETLSHSDRRRVYDEQLKLFGGHFPQPPV